MEYAIALAGLFFVHILALISPGPNVLIVTQSALSRDRRTGVVVALGLATGAALWSATALIGLDLLFAHVTWLYGAIKIAGGAYLIYLGIRLWRTAGESLGPPPDRATARTSGQSYRLGLLTSLTNPKAAIFFGGVFAAVLPPASPLWVKACALGLVVCDSAAFHAGLAVFFSTARVQQVYARIKKPVDRITGAVLSLLGLRLLLGR